MLRLSVQIRDNGAHCTQFVPAGKLMDLGSELLCDDRRENWCRVASIKLQLLKFVRITENDQPGHSVLISVPCG